MAEEFSERREKDKHTPLNIQERRRRLVQMIKEQGIVATAKRKDLDEGYRRLLDLLTRFEGIKHSKEVQEIIKPCLASGKRRAKYLLDSVSPKRRKK